MKECYDTYKDYKAPESELELLEKALGRVDIECADIIKFVKLCSGASEYDRALRVVKSRRIMGLETTDEQEKGFKQMEISLKEAHRVNLAQTLIRKGNTNTGELVEVTGLSKDKINIIKAKMLNTPLRLLGILGREKLLDGIERSTYTDLRQLCMQRNMSDFEISDIEEQAKYRRIIPRDRDWEQEIKQDSETRIIALFTKLGKSPEFISRGLKIQQEQIENDIEKALQVGLIKNDELQGIKILDKPSLEFEELDK